MEDQRERGGQMLVYVAAYAPILGIRTFFSYLRMKRAANRSSRQFYRSLVDSGVPSREAHALVDEYTAVVSVRYWVRGMTSNGPQRSKELRRYGKTER